MKRRSPLLAITGILCVTLVGCADSDLDSTPVRQPVGHPAEEEAGLDSEAAVSQIEVDPLACLHGTWLADNAFFLASMQEFGDEIQTVVGQVFLRFEADGTVATDYKDWVITALAEGMEVQVQRAGIDNGSFSVTGGTVNLIDTHIGSTITVTGAGMSMTVEPQPVNYVDSSYTCTPTHASILTVDGALELHRQ